MSSDPSITLVHVEVISTRNLSILQSKPTTGTPRIAVQAMIQEFDRASSQYIYGQELWTESQPEGPVQNYTTGAMEFRVRKPVDSKLILMVSNLDEQDVSYRFCGELRMIVSKLSPGAFPVTDTFQLEKSSYFPQREVAGDITVAVKYMPGVHPTNTNASNAPSPQSQTRSLLADPSRFAPAQATRQVQAPAPAPPQYALPPAPSMPPLQPPAFPLVDNALYASQAAVAQRELQVRLQQLAVREKELAVQAQELSLRESRLPVAADPSKLRAAPPPPSLPPQHGENSFYRQRGTPGISGWIPPSSQQHYEAAYHQEPQFQPPPPQQQLQRSLAPADTFSPQPRMQQFQLAVQQQHQPSALQQQQYYQTSPMQMDFPDLPHADPSLYQSNPEALVRPLVV